MLIHNLIGCLLVVIILLTILLFLVISIDMYFGQSLYFKMREKYQRLVERL